MGSPRQAKQQTVYMVLLTHGVPRLAWRLTQVFCSFVWQVQLLLAWVSETCHIVWELEILLGWNRWLDIEMAEREREREGGMA